MRAPDALGAFKCFLLDRRSSIHVLNGSSAADAMIDFYVATRADDVDLNASGDMLLFQFGTYDWGSGEVFEYDIVRQFIVEAKGDDAEQFLQLHLTFRHEATDEARALGSEHRWCEGLQATGPFREFIKTHAATTHAAASVPLSVSLDLDEAE